MYIIMVSIFRFPGCPDSIYFSGLPPFPSSLARAVRVVVQVDAKHDKLSPHISGGGRARYGLRAGERTGFGATIPFS